MTEHAEKEGIVPAGSLDFLTHGERSWMSTEDVEGEPAKDGQVFWSIVLSGAAAILVEDDVEYPVQPVLDTPMTAYDAQQCLRGHPFGEEIVMHGWALGATTLRSPARGDPAERNDTRKVVGGGKACIADDCGASPFASIVGAGFEPLGSTARSGAGEALHDGGEHLALILLECEHVVAATFEHHGSELAMAMQCIGGNRAALEAKAFQALPMRLRPRCGRALCARPTPSSPLRQRR